MCVEFRQSIPIFRMFSVEKAREFYIDYLGFQVDWEHRFEPELPLYMQVTRGGLTLHLSEHHGDCTPGARIFIEMTGVQELHAELTAKKYGYLRPGLQQEDWGLSMTVTDPFMNRITFNDRSVAKADA
jgi:ribosomal-protein-alanine N-acetyltransferase